MDDGRRTDDGRTPDHGHPISSPCEPNGSGELKTQGELGGQTPIQEVVGLIATCYIYAVSLNKSFVK